MLTIGQLAKESGVHLETIRYYEREASYRRPSQPSVTGHINRTPRGGFASSSGSSNSGFSLSEILGLLTLRAGAGPGLLRGLPKSPGKTG